MRRRGRLCFAAALAALLALECLLPVRAAKEYEEQETEEPDEQEETSEEDSGEEDSACWDITINGVSVGKDLRLLCGDSYEFFGAEEICLRIELADREETENQSEEAMPAVSVCLSSGEEVLEEAVLTEEEPLFETCLSREPEREYLLTVTESTVFPDGETGANVYEVLIRLTDAAEEDSDEEVNETENSDEPGEQDPPAEGREDTDGSGEVPDAGPEGQYEDDPAPDDGEMTEDGETPDGGIEQWESFEPPEESAPVASAIPPVKPDTGKKTLTIVQVDELEGKNLPFFQLPWEKSELLNGAEDAFADLFLDGEPYEEGDLISEAGLHELKVTASDGEGNRTEKTVRFVIHQQASKGGAMSFDPGKDSFAGVSGEPQAALNAGNSARRSDRNEDGSAAENTKNMMNTEKKIEGIKVKAASVSEVENMADFRGLMLCAAALLLLGIGVFAAEKHNGL